MTYQSLTIDNDTDDFLTALLQVDGRCPIKYAGDPTGVVASGFAPVFLINLINGDLYYCSAADGTADGTIWNLVNLNVFPASTTEVGVTRFATDDDFDDESNTVAVTPYSLEGRYAAQGDNADITSLSGLTTPVTVGQGGTGVDTLSGFINSLLPTQTSNATLYLTTNGTDVSWGKLGDGCAPFIKVKLTASLSPLVLGRSYDIDLASASANIILVLPDATISGNAGKQILVFIVSYSGSYYCQINTTGGQTYGGQASGTLSTSGLSSADTIGQSFIFEVNTLGEWNVISSV